MRNWDEILNTVFIIVLSVVIVFILGLLIVDSNNHTKRVGDKIVLESDTLIVVGNEYIGDKYNLSNGITINADYLKTLEIIEQ